MQREKPRKNFLAEEELSVLRKIYEDIPEDTLQFINLPQNVKSILSDVGGPFPKAVRQCASIKSRDVNIEDDDSFGDYSTKPTEKSSATIIFENKRKINEKGLKYETKPAHTDKIGDRVTNIFDTIMKRTPEKEHQNLCNFLDLLLIEMEAFDHARIKKQKDFKDSEYLPRPLAKTSFPVEITSVSELGPSSLLIEWQIYENLNIDHLEISIDGAPSTNCFSSKRTSGVVFDIDVHSKHRVSLMAIPKSESDQELDELCDEIMDKYGVPRKRRYAFNEKKASEEKTSWNASHYYYRPERKFLRPI